MVLSMNQPPVVIVTGSSRGLGRGIAETLAAAGYSVVIQYHSNLDAAQEVQTACQALATKEGQEFLLVQGDVSLAPDRDRLIGDTLDCFGRIDSLVNNAGIPLPVRYDITETTEESYDRIMNVNLKGPFFLTQALANHWLAHPNDSVIPDGYKLIFIGSVSSYAASVNRAEYCVSKAGLSMLNQLWAARLAAHGVLVVELSPGVMATDMTAPVKEKYDKLIEEGLVPQGRWGTPEDVGKAVRAVLEGQLSFSQGAFIPVDGGFHLRRL